MKTHKHHRLAFGVLATLIVVATTSLKAQNELEFAAGGYSGAIPNGPTISSQVITFLENTTGTTFASYTPAITATASLSNQQFTSNAPAINMGMVFGGTGNSGGTNMGSLSVFPLMNISGSPSNASYTSNPFGTSGTNIDVAQNRAFSIFLSCVPLQAAGASPLGRYYYGDLTITFNRPVSNPVLQISGLGANFNTSGGTQNASAELDITTSGVTLTQLSGTAAMNVSGLSILNNAALPSGACGSAGVCGSVRVNGSHLSSITMRVFLRGTRNGWTNGNHTGELFSIGVSLERPITVAGTILNDANGLTDNTLNGTGTNAGGLNAILVDNATGTVRQTTSVASDGTYSFLAVWRGDYAVRLSTSAGVVDAAPPTVSLPTNWISTGENLGAGAGNDGSVNGILSVNGITTTNISNVNFGIERRPFAIGRNVEIDPSPSYMSVVSLIPANGFPSLSGTDAEDGSLGAGASFRISSLSGMNGNELLYNGTQITGPTTINNYNPSLLAVRYSGLNSTSFQFTFNVFDAAGFSGLSDSTFRLNWNIPLPVTMKSFEVSTYKDFILLNWTTLNETNNSHFIIERAGIDNVWHPIGQVEGNGTISTPIDYTFIDSFPQKNIKLKYRLKQVDYNGSYEYSAIKSIYIYSNPVVIDLFPNPSYGEVYIYGKNIDIISFKDLTGKDVIVPFVKNPDNIFLSDLKTGIYFVEIKQGEAVITKRIIVQN